MIDACVHTITRDGKYLEACLDAICPFVKKVFVAVDSRSSLFHIRPRPNLRVWIFPVRNPYYDLVAMRQSMIEKTQEPWVWIMDDDEYYPPDVIQRISQRVGSADAYALQSWPVWNPTQHHVATSKAWIPRIFRNKGLKWSGKFGKERLYMEDQLPYYERIYERYIHLTHMKHPLWRKEMGQEREADARRLGNNPSDITRIVSSLL